MSEAKRYDVVSRYPWVTKQRLERGELTVPDNHILVLRWVVSSSPQIDAFGSLALVGELAGRVELAVAVSCDPDGPRGVAGASDVEAAWRHEKHRRGSCMQSVRYRFPRYGIDNVVIADFEHTVALDGSVCGARVAYHLVLGYIAASKWVRFIVDRHRLTVLIDDRIAEAIDGRIDTE